MTEEELLGAEVVTRAIFWEGYRYGLIAGMNNGSLPDMGEMPEDRVRFWVDATQLVANAKNTMQDTSGDQQKIQ